MEDVTISELQRLLASSTDENQQKILYVLDYVLNYFVGDRRIPTISYRGFSNELQQLKDIGLIQETRNYWRGNEYLRLFVKQEVKSIIEKLLEERYYPLFTTDNVNRKMREIITSSFPAATKLWSIIHEHNITEYDLSRSGTYDRELVELGEKLATNGLCYLIGYYSTSWAYSSDEIIFRKHPIDVRAIFLKIVEDEMATALSSLSPPMKWCLYLKHVYPEADEGFFLKNATTSFLPSQIKEALARLPSLELEKFKEIMESILSEQRIRLSEAIRSLINRDPITVTVFGTLFTLAQEEKRYRKVDTWSMNKIKETLRDYDTFSRYLSYFKSLGVIFTSVYDDIIIPQIVWEVFSNEIKGRAKDVKIFESELDAQAFLEEIMSKATSAIKIWDPYVQTRTLALLERTVKSDKVLVEILSSLQETKEPIQNLARKGMKIHAKIVYRSGKQHGSPWHDRYLIVDDENVWHLGPSLHGAGQKLWESAELFAKSLGDRIVDAFRYNFSKEENDWASKGYEVIEV